jgi:RNA polymerase sigma factor (TIGR02999 family)
MSQELETNEGRDLAELIPLAYEELRRIARQRVAELRPGGTLAPTDLVNEVLLRLLKRSDRAYAGPDHLVRVAALAMHNVLVDRARRRVAAKRGGGAQRVELDDDLPIAAPAENMLCFHEACESVRSRSEEHFELILLRIYAGLSTEEIAIQRGQSTRTVERHWKFIKAVLHASLQTGDAVGTASP